jgi:hypothetical protein
MLPLCESCHDPVGACCLEQCLKCQGAMCVRCYTQARLCEKCDNDVRMQLEATAALPFPVKFVKSKLTQRVWIELDN